MSLFNKLVEKIDVFQAKRKLNVSNSVSLSELNSFFSIASSRLYRYGSIGNNIFHMFKSFI